MRVVRGVREGLEGMSEGSCEVGSEEVTGMP